MRKPVFANAKTKTQISCAVTVQLISALDFATWILRNASDFRVYSQLSLPIWRLSAHTL